MVATFKWDFSLMFLGGATFVIVMAWVAIITVWIKVLVKYIFP